MKTEFQSDLVALVPRLRRFAFALCGQQDVADDLVQSACEKALKSQDKFTPGTRLDSWMYRIVQNLWFDQTRRNRTQGTKVDPDDIAISDEGVAARRPEARDMLDTIRSAIRDLPEDQRVVLALVAIEGRSYKETAESLNVPVGTVMSRLSRARTKLATYIDG